jgi:uracil-DNA glycosylase
MQTTCPAVDCPRCPRLVAFRSQNRLKIPGGWNNPVPSFGDLRAQLLIVGLAPGLHGANTTGRPFTGDYAGDLLYQNLQDFGFASGTYREHRDDGLVLHNCRITNAVRCVPPENKPTPDEMQACRPFLSAEIAAMPGLRVILVLGRVAHENTLKVLGHKPSAYLFGHGAQYLLPGGLTLISSYHCSRYNTSTKRLTPEAFALIFHKINTLLNRE